MKDFSNKIGRFARIDLFALPYMDEFTLFETFHLKAAISA